MIIPDCFDVNKPLPGYTPPVIESEYPVPPPILPHDNMTRSSDSHMTFSEPEPEVKHKPIPTPSQPPTLTSSTPPQGATHPTARHEFVPQRVTIKNVQDARRLYKRPLTLATGLVNAVSDLVSEKVTFAPSGNKATDVVVVDTREEESSSSDEEFEVSCYMYCTLEQVRLTVDLKFVHSTHSLDLLMFSCDRMLLRLSPLTMPHPLPHPLSRGRTNSCLM